MYCGSLLAFKDLGDGIAGDPPLTRVVLDPYQLG